MFMHVVHYGDHSALKDLFGCCSEHVGELSSAADRILASQEGVYLRCLIKVISVGQLVISM